MSAIYEKERSLWSSHSRRSVTSQQACVIPIRVLIFTRRTNANRQRQKNWRALTRSKLEKTVDNLRFKDYCYSGWIGKMCFQLTASRWCQLEGKVSSRLQRSLFCLSYGTNVANPNRSLQVPPCVFVEHIVLIEGNQFKFRDRWCLPKSYHEKDVTINDYVNARYLLLLKFQKRLF